MPHRDLAIEYVRRMYSVCACKGDCVVVPRGDQPINRSAGLALDDLECCTLYCADRLYCRLQFRTVDVDDSMDCLVFNFVHISSKMIRPG